MKHKIIILGSIAICLGLGEIASVLSFTSCNSNNTNEAQVKETSSTTDDREARAFVAGDTVPPKFLRTATDTAGFFHIEPFVTIQTDTATIAATQNLKKSGQQPLGVAQDSLRRVLCLHVDAEGRNLVGEIVVHHRIANTVLGILRQLYEAHYPIECMIPTAHFDYDDERSMAANNTSGYCPRRIAGQRRLSKHALGLAVDVNPLYNPYVRNGGKIVSPAVGKRYADRCKKYKYKVEKGDLCHKLFKQAGFTWGGDWRTTKDYQHFEMRN